MELGNLLDKAKQAAIEVKNKVEDQSDKVGDAILSVVDDLNSAIPHLAAAGYTMDKLEIEVGVPPKLIPHFTLNETLVKNSEQSLTNLEGNTVGYALFKALLKATELQKKIMVTGMDFARLEIELGLIPAVRLSYEPKPSME